MRKILIACPTANLKDYCLDDWMENISNFTYPNVDILLVDNSEYRDYYVELKNRFAHLPNFKVERVTPQHFPDFKFALAKSHDICRQRAIEGNYDYLLHLESDIFPPHDVIERLLDCKKKMVGAMYHIELGERSSLMIQKIEDFGDVHRETYNLEENDLLFVDGTVKQVFSCGLGCVLIHKSILKQFSFRTDFNTPVHPDSFLYADLDAKQIKVYVDTSIYCDHRNHSLLRV